VPLDRTGALPGTVQLSVERRGAGAQPTRDAVVALAGGPGQATLPVGEFIAKAIAPALDTRDLLLFDQRGTGASDALSCSALEQLSNASEARLNEQCALDIGPARADFTTAESVQDIEALRSAGGYEKLVLYGTSYGTKVALNYAERYPQHVEALVLDSVVPSAGEEPFYIPSYQAIGSMFAELCSAGACSGIAPDPLGDIARLAASLRRHPLHGSVYDGAGRRHAATLEGVGLFRLLIAGDLNPALRALLPAAVRSALRNDPDPLLRLSALSEGLVPSLPSALRAASSSSEFNEALFATTICEETPFPWQRSASQSTRLAEALRFLHAQSARSFYPFDLTTAFQASLIPGCSAWPDASAAPPPASPLPQVPALIFSGGQDLRTPTTDARQVASEIPGAQLEIVPFTGHSVVGADLSGCAAAALKSFFSGEPVQPCGPVSDRFAPTPVTPTSVSYVQPPAGLSGRAGQTLVVVLDTLVDLNRQVIGATIQAEQALPAGSSFGGLRGGYARLTSGSVVLRNFSFVAGVKLNGTLPLSNGELQSATLRIAGSQAAAGTVHVSSTSKIVTGALGGRHFAVSIAHVKLASARGGDEWPSASRATALLAGAARLGGPAPRPGGARLP